MTLLIDQNEDITRLALMDGDRLAELVVEKNAATSRVGQIIVGRIRNIMPGNFAFIYIGPGKNAFANLAANHGLKHGQPLLVQVQKDATSSKGAYVSHDISVKGRLVILHQHPPGEVGVSHKISDEKETRRLKNAVRKLLPKGYGAIVRTSAEGASAEDLAAEIEKLRTIYEETLQKAEFALPPAVLHPKITDNIEALLSDFATNVDEIIVSGTDEFYEAIKSRAQNVTRHSHEEGKLFHTRGIKKQTRAALEKIVPLPGGGFITIEQTEACAVIDVNTGASAAADNYRETVLATNMEAVAAIVNQIILRNLGGIIIIDFISLSRQDDKAAVTDALRKEAKRDRLNPEIFNMSELGIVQIARPKRRLPLSHILEEKCPHCGGRGLVSVGRST